MSSTANNWVLGFATRMPRWQVTPFLRSLHRTAYRGGVRLFGKDVAAEDRAVLEAWGQQAGMSKGLEHRPVEVTDLAGEYGRGGPCVQRTILRLVHRTRGLRRGYPAAFRAVTRIGRRDGRGWRRNWLEWHINGPQSLRYRHFLRFIEERPEIGHVLLTDVRDVVFQDDPFRWPMKGDLQLFLEPAHVRFGTDPTNSYWVKSSYGERTLSAMAGRTVSCSGTTLGTRKGILRYLRAMCEELERLADPRAGLDQAVHNVLLYRGGLGDVELVTNGEGAVQTIGQQEGYVLDDAQQVRNQDGTLPAVVHQYDRHPTLYRLFVGRYGCGVSL